MSRINVDSRIFSDPRFLVLAPSCSDKFQALGKLLHVWHHCTEFLTPIVAKKFIDIICEQIGFAEHLVSCGLAKPIDADHVCIAGVQDRIEYLLDRKRAGIKGGKRSHSDKQKRNVLKQKTVLLSAPTSKSEISLSKKQFCSSYMDMDSDKDTDRDIGIDPGRDTGRDTGMVSPLPPKGGTDPGAIARLWNDFFTDSEIPSIQLDSVRSGTTRRVTLISRIKDHPDIEWWRELFERIQKSTFLSGKAPGRDGGKPFRATFDWVIKAANLTKISEGNYDNPPAPFGSRLEDWPDIVPSDRSAEA